MFLSFHSASLVIIPSLSLFKNHDNDFKNHDIEFNHDVP